MPARPLMRSACALALLLASAGAHALGLGQIRVLSGPGEPLVAEIPVISGDPSELQALRAALASPETFTRIGLEPPIGAVADLRFATSADAAGRPVIRVTTTQPVTEPMLTFLVEVDWGQGRLVREYSALVATPNSVAAQPVAPVQVPQVQTPAVVERPRPAVAAAPAPEPVAPSAPSAPQQAAPRPATPAARPAPVAASPADSVRVRAGDTLSGIAALVAPEDVTAEQTMVGLLRANPQAFVGGDMNQLRRGAVLRVPIAAELEAIEAREAAELVRGYARQWRQARTQPQAPVAEVVAPTGPAAAAPSAGGRLEIVPPGAGRAAQAGTQSGIAAGGEGDMLRKELQTTKETLAARDAELQELRSRVAELERLQTDQQKLIALKDAELTAAQNRAGQANATQADPSGASVMPWVAGGALVLLGLIAAGWARRRRAASAFNAPTERRASIADAFAADATGSSDAQARAAEPAGTPGSPAAAASARAAAPAAVAASTPAERPVPVAESAGSVPSWERSSAASRRGGVRAPTAPVPAPTPAWATGEPATLALQVEPANAERLELAQAYLDLGDTERARQVLAEVESSDDAMARGVASRMRQGIG